MKYSVLIIDSDDIDDYCVESSASGIRYDHLDKNEVDILVKISLEQNFSVVIQREEE